MDELLALRSLPRGVPSILALKAPLEKASRLYRFVAKNCTLAGTSLKRTSFLPRSAGRVLQTMYGNYLDKTFLYYALLRRAGVPAELVLLRDQNKGALIRNVPALAQFNDAVVNLPTLALVTVPDYDNAPIHTLSSVLQPLPGSPQATPARRAPRRGEARCSA